MFTGLVQESGRLAADPVPSGQGGVRMVLAHSAELGRRLEIGASLAVSGVCLTILELAPLPLHGGGGGMASTVELAPETLDRTTLGGLRAGDRVNLETALRMGDALGGHWVQGHVDGTVAVVGREDLADHRVVAFAMPAGDLAPLLVEKGSITLDGVSLTIASRRNDRFTVALLPHTLAVTTLGDRTPGDRVNLEVDVLGKYVHQILAARGLA